MHIFGIDLLDFRLVSLLVVAIQNRVLINNSIVLVVEYKIVVLMIHKHGFGEIQGVDLVELRLIWLLAELDTQDRGLLFELELAIEGVVQRMHHRNGAVGALVFSTRFVLSFSF